MANTAFDTTVRNLEATKLTPAQARAIAEAARAGYDEFATKADLEAEIGGLKTSLVKEIANGKVDNADVKTAIAELKTSLVKEIAGLKDNLATKADLEAAKTDLKDNLASKATLWFALLLFAGFVVAAIVGLNQLLP